MPWIHIDDEVALILWALDTVDISGPVNAAAPKFAVTAMRGSEVADFVTASLRVMPRRALDKGYTFRFPELEPALRDLLGKRSTGARLTWHRSNLLRGAGGWLREECVHPA
jgi:uncharacterized protein